MLNNNHNPSCAFAEQIVSYLYGETIGKEKAAFDAHLKNCSSCADELAGFGFVRASIVEWKTEEFLNLETPSINIPYPIAVATEKQSWLGELRKLFALSPTWATAFAVLVVCVGLVLLVVNFSNNNDVARKVEKPTNEVVSPIVEEKPTPRMEETAQQDSSKVLLKPSIVENASEKNAPQIAPKNQIVKVSNNVRKNKGVAQNANDLVANVRKLKDDKNTLTARKQVVPKLNGLEEEEDNSVRLADLFAEVESK